MVMAIDWPLRPCFGHVGAGRDIASNAPVLGVDSGVDSGVILVARWALLVSSFLDFSFY